jgi:hypothetical protein
MFASYPFQIEHATRLGADHIIYPIDPYASVQRVTQSHLYKGILGNRTLTGGYDVIYETVGQQKTLHHALRWLRAQGTMVLVGLSLRKMRIDLTPLWHQEINLLGSLSHGRETWPSGLLPDLIGTPSDRSTFSVVTGLIQQKRIQPEELITHRFALDKYPDALKAAQYKKKSQSVKVLFDYALLSASAVPNLRASARSQRPALSQPQGDAFMEELLKAQNATGRRQDSEQEAIPQSSMAQQTLPPKILDTPPPQVFAKESAQAVLNGQELNRDDTDEETDPAIPVIRRPPYNSRISSRVLESSPQTPMPPAIEPTPVLIVETPETKTDESEANSLSAQPMPEPQKAEAASEFPTSTDDTLLEVPAELLANEEELISALPETTDMTSTDNTLLESVELPANEEGSILPLPEVMEMNALTEEQLPTQTVLDHLFDADASSMPAFLAELSNFGIPMIPEMPMEEAEGTPLAEPSGTALPIEGAEAHPLPEASEIAQTIEDKEASSLPEASETVLSVEEVEAHPLPEASETALSVEEAEAHPLPKASETAQSVEEAESSPLAEPSETTLPIEEAEGTPLPEASETALSVEEAEGSSLPEASEAARPVKEAEVPLAPDTSTNEVPMDSSDQIMGDLTERVKAISKPQAKGKRKTSKSAQTSTTDRQDEKKQIEEKLLPKTQPEQVAAMQEQVTTNTDEKAE